MATVRHPYPGPSYTTPGDATLSCNQSAFSQGPNIDCGYLYITPDAAWAGASTVKIGTSTASVGGVVVYPQSPPIFFPVTNVNQLYFKGSTTLTLNLWYGN